MKIFTFALTLSLLVIFLAAAVRFPLEVETVLGASTIMQQSYELRCRGGGSMKFN